MNNYDYFIQELTEALLDIGQIYTNSRTVN